MMDGFNLYREAKNYYNKLIPEKIEGLIILSLYQKYGENEFNEAQIIHIIETIFRDLGQESSRTENERNNNIILSLQDYFLWRDELSKLYHFKSYGLDFCRRINKRLHEGYSPATIKRWFDELYNTLQNLKNIDGGFSRWIVDYFEIKHTLLAEQIEILDQRVIESVKQFKKEIKADDEIKNIVQVLENIELRLELIKQQATELKKAFQTTYDIDDVLTEILQEYETELYLAEIQRVSRFNDNVRSQLEQVSKRIDKIKPRIREFIYDFNQRDFDRKTERFIYFLLNCSKNEKDSNLKKILSLPTGVPPKLIGESDQLPRFTLISLKEISPRLPIVISKRVVDDNKRLELVEKTRLWLLEKEKITYWTNLAIQGVYNEGMLDFSPFFFRILSEEKGNIAIGVKIANRVLKNSLNNKDFTVDIQQEIIRDKSFPNITLWKMKIWKI